MVTVLGPTSVALTADAAHHELSAVHGALDDDFRPGTSLELITGIRRQMMATLERLIGSTASGPPFWVRVAFVRYVRTKVALTHSFPG